MKWNPSSSVVVAVVAAAAVIITTVAGSEWNTAAGLHCIDACRYPEGGVNLYYWCHTAKEHTDKKGNRLHWDHCTPTRFFSLNETSLAWEETEGNVTGLGTVRTALYPQTKCTGACSGDPRLCPTETDNPFAINDTADGTKRFYCTDETVKPKREQLSSVEGLWCIDDCRKDDDDFYRCTTLLGKDYCSPERDKTTNGDECYHPCQYNSDGIKNEEDETAGLYFCFGTAANSTRKGCGYYPKEDRDTLERLEYAVVGTAGQVGSSLSICADQCHPEYDGDPYEQCAVLEWKEYPSGNGHRLVKEFAYCLGRAPPVPPMSIGTIVGLAIFVVAVGLVCGCVVWSQVRKKADPR